MKIHTETILELTVTRYSHLREVLDFDPPYQREGGVWSKEMRGRLIDSIINGFDLPKLYFERATTRRKGVGGRTIQYAVLDGKQRLESISEFLNGDLPLPDDFWYYENRDVEAAGLTYLELQQRYPQLAQRLLDFELPVVSVIADSTDLVEEMFQRLNASTTLNAAERRNAVSGPTRDAANDLAEHPLLRVKSPIKSARYKYRELGAKFLAIEEQLDSRERLSDTKAATLYELFVATKPDVARISAERMETYRAKAESTLNKMMVVFEDDDVLLSSIGTVVVYYIAFRNDAFADNATRSTLERFEELRRDASRMSEDNPEYARPANARLREYNVYVQSTNDGSALSRRSEILTAFVRGYREDDELGSLDGLADGDPLTEEVEEE